MAEHLVPDDLLILLREVDTPTVCNAIEVVHGQRVGSCYRRYGLSPLHRRLVGEVLICTQY